MKEKKLKLCLYIHNIANLFNDAADSKNVFEGLVDGMETEGRETEHNNAFAGLKFKMSKVA